MPTTMAASLVGSDDAHNESFLEDFSCRICLEILRNPMQCLRNEHYFCATCITKHLENSATCPMCLEELTSEELRPAPRIILNVVSKFKIPRCDYVQRGCKEVIQPEDLPFHHEVCGFAPILCANDGCNETVDRQDKENHERSCRLRKIKCESCNKEMTHQDHTMHGCVLRKEIDNIKLFLKDATEMLKEIQEQQRTQAQSIQNLQDPLRCPSSSQFSQERVVVVNGQIFVAGGSRKDGKKSLEVFNWSTKSWTLFKDCLFFQRYYSFSFPYGKKIMICGGQYSNRIEYFNPSENAYTSTVIPSILQENCAKGTVCGNCILTFGNDVHQNQLESPWSSNDLLRLPEYTSHYGVECFGDKIVLVGGNEEVSDSVTATPDMVVRVYDVSQHEMKLLSPLPFKVSKMATVAYKDNIIIIGGQDENNSPLNSVLMYNVSSEECKKLPSMLEKRSGCAAVIMGDVIIVMGGCSQNPGQGIKRIVLNSVEYYILEDGAWKELPAMHVEREGATACVQV